MSGQRAKKFAKFFSTSTKHGHRLPHFPLPSLHAPLTNHCSPCRRSALVSALFFSQLREGWSSEGKAGAGGRGCLFIALCDLPSIRRRGSRRRAPAFPRLPRLRLRRLRRCPPPPPTLISSDPRSPARCLAHRMSPRRPRPAASPPPTAAAHNPPPPPGFPTPLPPLLRPPEATGPGNPEPRRARTLAGARRGR